MVREANPQDSAALQRIFAAQPGIGAQPAADWALQQQLPGLGWQFYLVGSNGALRLGGSGRATLCGRADNPEELAAFLNMLGVERLTSGDCCIPGFEKTEGLVVMQRPPAQAQPPPALPGYDPAPPMAAVLEVLESSDGRMAPEEVRESFQTDNRVRRSRGFASIRGVWQQARLLSTAGAYGITDTEAYIACVETRPEARHRGLAGALVQGLCADYADRHISLVCRREMAPYYGRFGFVETGGRVCFYKRKGGRGLAG